MLVVMRRLKCFRVGKSLVILATHFSVLDNDVTVYKALRAEQNHILWYIHEYEQKRDSRRKLCWSLDNSKWGWKGSDSGDGSYSGLGVDGREAMLERIGTAVAILTDWRRRGSNPRQRLDGTWFSLERKEYYDYHIILITKNLRYR